MLKLVLNLVILCQTFLEIYDCLTLLRTTTPADGPYDNRAKRRLAQFCQKIHVVTPAAEADIEDSIMQNAYAGISHGNEVRESRFPHLITFSKSVSGLLRNRGFKLTKKCILARFAVNRKQPMTSFPVKM